MLKRIRDLLTRRGKQPASEAPSVRPGESTVETQEKPRVQQGPRVVHQPIPRSDLDPDAVKIVHRLTRFDHAAYLVGGCVRDLLLERKPKDFDIGTSATPRQIKRVFRNCRIIGRRFRLAHIYFQNGKIIEVATFRGQDDDDGEAAGKDLLIRDDNQFGTMEQDALRRDFTINSLFYDVNRGTVLDHADGLGDLRRRMVRTIGDATTRFKEDPIRILRAIKFAARLDFDIERETLEALRRTRTEIPKAAAPRILEEINRFCRGGAARRSFELLREHGVFEVIAPEIAGRYRDDPAAWKLLLRLLGGFDHQTADGIEVTTGEILGTLLLPTVMDDLGWKVDGTIEPVEGLDVRAVVDESLRPLAIRLRISKKDQEHCRQVIATLHRMVPVGSMHRNTRRSILRRVSLPQALTMLGILAETMDGEYAEAERHWRKATSGRTRRKGASPAAPPRKAQEDAPAEPKRRKRRRGSRGGAERQHGAAGGARDEARKDDRSAERPPAPRSRPKKDENLPPVWDDDYFFAALPSVPEGTEKSIEGNRYGPPEPDRSPQDAADHETEPAAEETADKPKRRRRPRRRRKPTRTTGKDDDGGHDG